MKTNAALLIITALLLNTCGVRRIAVPNPPTHGGPGWVAAPQEPGKFLIIARDNAASMDAVKTLCSKEYICFGPDYLGEALLVERRKK